MEPLVYQQFLEMEQNHWWFRGRRKVYLGLLETVLAGRRRGRALDLGCGWGGFLPGLSALGYEVYGADNDLDTLRHCASRGYGRCASVDAYSLPYADQSFDVVALFDAVEHIEDDRQCIAEVKRVLKPGGVAVVTVPAYQYLYSNSDRTAQHYRRYNRQQIECLFQSQGLAMVRNSHSNVFLFPLILPIVLITKLLENLFNRKQDASYNNLSWPIPGVLHHVLYGIFSAELAFTRHWDWPVGHSLIAVAERPDE